jgi:signal transduction histidine kinase
MAARNQREGPSLARQAKVDRVVGCGVARVQRRDDIHTRGQRRRRARLGRVHGTKAHAIKAQGARQFTKVREAILRLTRLMDNVLLLSQVQDGRLCFQPIGFNLAQVLERVVSEFQRNVGAHRLEVVGEPLPAHFFGDQYLMEVMLTNVLSNAFKYSPPEKSVTVTVRRSGDELTIDVRDEGVGMSVGALARVGEKFYRSENVSHIEGMGLGVYLTRRLVEYHQGQMTIVSAEGQGTIVTLRFPRISFTQDAVADSHAA